MPKRTNKYQIDYFLDGEPYLSELDKRRFEIIDSQIGFILNEYSTGIISGFDVSLDETNPLKIIVSDGIAIIKFNDNNIAIRKNSISEDISINPFNYSIVYLNVVDDEISGYGSFLNSTPLVDPSFVKNLYSNPTYEKDYLKKYQLFENDNVNGIVQDIDIATYDIQVFVNGIRNYNYNLLSDANFKTYVKFNSKRYITDSVQIKRIQKNSIILAEIESNGDSITNINLSSRIYSVQGREDGITIDEELMLHQHTGISDKINITTKTKLVNKFSTSDQENYVFDFKDFINENDYLLEGEYSASEFLKNNIFKFKKIENVSHDKFIANEIVGLSLEDDDFIYEGCYVNPDISENTVYRILFSRKINNTQHDLVLKDFYSENIKLKKLNEKYTILVYSFLPIIYKNNEIIHSGYYVSDITSSNFTISFDSTNLKSDEIKCQLAFIDEYTQVYNMLNVDAYDKEYKYNKNISINANQINDFNLIDSDFIPKLSHNGINQELLIPIPTEDSSISNDSYVNNIECFSDDLLNYYPNYKNVNYFKNIKQTIKINNNWFVIANNTLYKIDGERLFCNSNIANIYIDDYDIPEKLYNNNGILYFITKDHILYKYENNLISKINKENSLLDIIPYSDYLICVYSNSLRIEIGDGEFEFYELTNDDLVVKNDDYLLIFNTSGNKPLKRIYLRLYKIVFSKINFEDNKITIPIIKNIDIVQNESKIILYNASNFINSSVISIVENTNKQTYDIEIELDEFLVSSNDNYIFIIRDEVNTNLTATKCFVGQNDLILVDSSNLYKCDLGYSAGGNFRYKTIPIDSGVSEIKYLSEIYLNNNEYTYGYGYGFGLGFDYFDSSLEFSNLFNSTDHIDGYSIGYFYDVNLDLVSAYGYGYGYELAQSRYILAATDDGVYLIDNSGLWKKIENSTYDTNINVNLNEINHISYHFLDFDENKFEFYLSGKNGIYHLDSFDSPDIYIHNALSFVGNPYSHYEIIQNFGYGYGYGYISNLNSYFDAYNIVGSNVGAFNFSGNFGYGYEFIEQTNSNSIYNGIFNFENKVYGKVKSFNSSTKKIVVESDLKDFNINDVLYFVSASDLSGRFFRILEITTIDLLLNSYEIRIDPFDGINTIDYKVKLYSTFYAYKLSIPLLFINNVPQKNIYNKFYIPYTFDYENQKITFSKELSFRDKVCLISKTKHFYLRNNKWDNSDDIKVFIKNRLVNYIEGNIISYQIIKNKDNDYYRIILYAENNPFKGFNLNGLTIYFKGNVLLTYDIYENLDNLFSINTYNPEDVLNKLEIPDGELILDHGVINKITPISFRVDILNSISSDQVNLLNFGTYNIISLPSYLNTDSDVRVSVDFTSSEVELNYFGNNDHSVIDDKITIEENGFNYNFDGIKNSNLLQFFNALKTAEASLNYDGINNIDVVDFVSNLDEIDFDNSTVENSKIYDSDNVGEFSNNIFGLLYDSSYLGIFAATDNGIFFKPNGSSSFIKWNKKSNIPKFFNINGNPTIPENIDGVYLGYDKDSDVWSLKWGKTTKLIKLNKGLDDYYITSIDYDNNDKNIIYVSTKKQGVFRLTRNLDDSISWDVIFRPNSFDYLNSNNGYYEVSKVRVSKNNSNLIYVLVLNNFLKQYSYIDPLTPNDPKTFNDSIGGLYVSNDKGVTFKKIVIPDTLTDYQSEQGLNISSRRISLPSYYKSYYETKFSLMYNSEFRSLCICTPSISNHLGIQTDVYWGSNNLFAFKYGSEVIPNSLEWIIYGILKNDIDVNENRNFIINDIAYDSDNLYKLYIGTSYGLYYSEYDATTFSFDNILLNLINENIYECILNFNDIKYIPVNLLVGDNKYIYVGRYNQKAQIINCIIDYDNKLVTLQVECNFVLTSNIITVYIPSFNKIDLNLEASTFSKEILCLYYDNTDTNNILYVGLKGLGVIKYDEDAHTSTYLNTGFDSELTSISVSSIESFGGVIYCSVRDYYGFGGGIFKLNGTTWERVGGAYDVDYDITDGLSSHDVTSIKIVNATSIYAGTSSGIYYSDNIGTSNTWEKVSLPTEFVNALNIFYDQRTLFLGNKYSGFNISKDKGLNWYQDFDPNNYNLSSQDVDSSYVVANLYNIQDFGINMLDREYYLENSSKWKIWDLKQEYNLNTEEDLLVYLYYDKYTINEIGWTEPLIYESRFELNSDTNKLNISQNISSVYTHEINVMYRQNFVIDALLYNSDKQSVLCNLSYFNYNSYNNGNPISQILGQSLSSKSISVKLSNSYNNEDNFIENLLDHEVDVNNTYLEKRRGISYLSLINNSNQSNWNNIIISGLSDYSITDIIDHPSDADYLLVSTSNNGVLKIPKSNYNFIPDYYFCGKGLVELISTGNYKITDDSFIFPEDLDSTGYLIKIKNGTNYNHYAITYASKNVIYFSTSDLYDDSDYYEYSVYKIFIDLINGDSASLSNYIPSLIESGIEYDTLTLNDASEFNVGDKLYLDLNRIYNSQISKNSENRTIVFNVEKKSTNDLSVKREKVLFNDFDKIRFSGTYSDIFSSVGLINIPSSPQYLKLRNELGKIVNKDIQYIGKISVYLEGSDYKSENYIKITQINNYYIYYSGTIVDETKIYGYGYGYGEGSGSNYFDIDLDYSELFSLTNNIEASSLGYFVNSSLDSSLGYFYGFGYEWYDSSSLDQKINVEIEVYYSPITVLLKNNTSDDLNQNVGVFGLSLNLSSLSINSGFEDFESEYTGEIDLNINKLNYISGSSYVYTATERGVFRYEYGAGSPSWENVTNGKLKNYSIKNIVGYNDGSKDILFVCSFGDGVYRSLDNGNTWDNISNDLKYIKCFDLCLNQTNDVLYVGTKFGGIYKSSNISDFYSEVTWSSDNSGDLYNYNNFNWKIKNLNDVLYLYSDGGGIYKYDSGIITDICYGLLSRNISSIDFSIDENKLFVSTNNAGVFYLDNNQWYKLNDLLKENLNVNNIINYNDQYMFKIVRNNNIDITSFQIFHEDGDGVFSIIESNNLYLTDDYGESWTNIINADVISKQCENLFYLLINNSEIPGDFKFISGKNIYPPASTKYVYLNNHDILSENILNLDLLYNNSCYNILYHTDTNIYSQKINSTTFEQIGEIINYRGLFRFDCFKSFSFDPISYSGVDLTISLISPGIQCSISPVSDNEYELLSESDKLGLFDLNGVPITVGASQISIGKRISIIFESNKSNVLLDSQTEELTGTLNNIYSIVIDATGKDNLLCDNLFVGNYIKINSTIYKIIRYSVVGNTVTLYVYSATALSSIVGSTIQIANGASLNSFNIYIGYNKENKIFYVSCNDGLSWCSLYEDSNSTFIRLKSFTGYYPYALANDNDNNLIILNSQYLLAKTQLSDITSGEKIKYIHNINSNIYALSEKNIYKYESLEYDDVTNVLSCSYASTPTSSLELNINKPLYYLSNKYLLYSEDNIFYYSENDLSFSNTNRILLSGYSIPDVSSFKLGSFDNINYDNLFIGGSSFNYLINTFSSESRSSKQIIIKNNLIGSAQNYQLQSYNVENIFLNTISLGLDPQGNYNYDIIAFLKIYYNNYYYLLCNSNSLMETELDSIYLKNYSGLDIIISCSESFLYIKTLDGSQVNYNVIPSFYFRDNLKITGMEFLSDEGKLYLGTSSGIYEISIIVNAKSIQITLDNNYFSNSYINKIKIFNSLNVSSLLIKNVVVIASDNYFYKINGINLSENISRYDNLSKHKIEDIEYDSINDIVYLYSEQKNYSIRLNRLYDNTQTITDGIESFNSIKKVGVCYKPYWDFNYTRDYSFNKAYFNNIYFRLNDNIFTGSNSYSIKILVTKIFGGIDSVISSKDNKQNMFKVEVLDVNVDSITVDLIDYLKIENYDNLYLYYPRTGEYESIQQTNFSNATADSINISVSDPSVYVNGDYVYVSDIYVDDSNEFEIVIGDYNYIKNKNGINSINKDFLDNCFYKEINSSLSVDNENIKYCFYYYDDSLKLKEYKLFSINNIILSIETDESQVVQYSQSKNVIHIISNGSDLFLYNSNNIDKLSLSSQLTISNDEYKNSLFNSNNEFYIISSSGYSRRNNDSQIELVLNDDNDFENIVINNNNIFAKYYNDIQNYYYNNNFELINIGTRSFSSNVLNINSMKMSSSVSSKDVNFNLIYKSKKDFIVLELSGKLSIIDYNSCFDINISENSCIKNNFTGNNINVSYKNYFSYDNFYCDDNGSYYIDFNSLFYSTNKIVNQIDSYAVDDEGIYVTDIDYFNNKLVYINNQNVFYETSANFKFSNNIFSSTILQIVNKNVYSIKYDNTYSNMYIGTNKNLFCKSGVLSWSNKFEAEGHINSINMSPNNNVFFIENKINSKDVFSFSKYYLFTRIYRMETLKNIYSYGYGYGFGSGEEFFDVYDIEGTTIGYGDDLFESTYISTYGYGYGYESISYLENIDLIANCFSEELNQDLFKFNFGNNYFTDKLINLNNVSSLEKTYSNDIIRSMYISTDSYNNESLVIGGDNNNLRFINTFHPANDENQKLNSNGTLTHGDLSISLSYKDINNCLYNSYEKGNIIALNNIAKLNKPIRTFNVFSSPYNEDIMVVNCFNPGEIRDLTRKSHSIIYNEKSLDYDYGFLMLTNDGGSTWTRIGEQLPIESIKSSVIFDKYGNIYVGLFGKSDSTNGVYVSYDNGNNFIDISNNLPKYPVKSLCIIYDSPDEVGTLYVGLWGYGLFKMSLMKIGYGYAYGYGYGFGSGGDFFDVYNFEGDRYGYGVGNFETTFSSLYGYGFGYEFGYSFESPLFDVFNYDFSQNEWNRLDIGIGYLNGKNLLSNNIVDISSFHDDKNLDYLWLATKDDGVLFSIEEEDSGDSFKRVFNKFNNGLLNSDLTCILSSTISGSRVWLGTEEGFYKKSLKSEEWELQETSQGIPSDIYVTKIKEDTIYNNIFIPVTWDNVSGSSGTLVLRNKKQVNVDFPQNNVAYSRGDYINSSFVVYRGSGDYSSNSYYDISRNLDLGDSYYYSFYSYVADGDSITYTSFPSLLSGEMEGYYPNGNKVSSTNETYIEWNNLESNQNRIYVTSISGKISSIIYHNDISEEYYGYSELFLADIYSFEDINEQIYPVDFYKIKVQSFITSYGNLISGFKIKITEGLNEYEYDVAFSNERSIYVHVNLTGTVTEDNTFELYPDLLNDKLKGCLLNPLVYQGSGITIKKYEDLWKISESGKDSDLNKYYITVEPRIDGKYISKYAENNPIIFFDKNGNIVNFSNEEKYGTRYIEYNGTYYEIVYYYSYIYLSENYLNEDNYNKIETEIPIKRKLDDAGDILYYYQEYGFGNETIVSSEYARKVIYPLYGPAVGAFFYRYGNYFNVVNSKQEFASTITTIYIGTEDGLYCTYDDCKTFSHILDNYYINDIAISEENANVLDIITYNNSVIYVSTTTGLLKTVDSGSNWIVISEFNGDNIKNINIIKDSLGKEIVYIFKEDGVNSEFWKSYDNGNTWVVVDVDLGDYADKVNNVYSYEKELNTFLIATDGEGVIYLKEPNNEHLGITIKSTNKISSIINNNMQLGDSLIGLKDRLIIDSILRNSIDRQKEIEFKTGETDSLDIEVKEDGYYVAKEDIYVGSLNINTYFNPFKVNKSTSEQYPEHIFCITKIDSETIFVGSNKGAYLSKDLGESWFKVGYESLPNIIYAAQILPDGFLYVGTSNGLWVSKDNGLTFELYGFSNLNVRSMWSSEDGIIKRYYFGIDNGILIIIFGSDVISITTPENFSDVNGINFYWGSYDSDGDLNPGGVPTYLLDDLNLIRSYLIPGESDPRLSSGFSGVLVLRKEGNAESSYIPGNDVSFEIGDICEVKRYLETRTEYSLSDYIYSSESGYSFLEDGLIVVDNLMNNNLNNVPIPNEDNAYKYDTIMDDIIDTSESEPKYNTYTSKNKFSDTVPSSILINGFPDFEERLNLLKLKSNTTYYYSLFAYHIRPVVDADEVGLGETVIATTGREYYKFIPESYSYLINIRNLPNATQILCGQSIDESKWVVGTDAGAFYSTDGTNLFASNLTKKVYSIIVQSSKVFAGTEDGIYVSSNNGQTYIEVFSFTNTLFDMVYDFEVGNNDILYAATNNGVLKKSLISDSVWELEPLVGSSDYLTKDRILGQTIKIN